MERVDSKKIRIGMGIAAALLFAAEIYIGKFHHGDWIRNSLGDILVVILIYCLLRVISPKKPRWNGILPVAVLLFAIAVECLQGWGFVDKFHITNSLLRTIIGTTFKWGDLLCYAAGCLPIFLLERLTARHSA